jgi:hypothetical protein
MAWVEVEEGIMASPLLIQWQGTLLNILIIGRTTGTFFTFTISAMKDLMPLS